MTKKITSFFTVSKVTQTTLSASTTGGRKRQTNEYDITNTQRNNIHNADDTILIDDIDAKKRMKLSQPLVVSKVINKAVEELLKYLRDDNDDTAMSSSSWKKLLQSHFQSNSFQQLANFIASERRLGSPTIYPSNNNVWTALNLCTIQNVKVVIVGQDPYHQPNQAHGLSFSVLPTCPTGVPPSLKNIYKELLNDPKVTTVTKIPHHGYLIRWVEQGVLLLNTVLTVRHNTPNSHQKKGWENVTDEIIHLILQYQCGLDNKNNQPQSLPNDNTGTTTTSVTNGRRGCVFLLWGKPATTKAMQVIESTTKRYDPKLYKVICTSHPSPLGATKTSSPFMGSHCFSRCNDALIQMGHTPIDWNVG